MAQLSLTKARRGRLLAQAMRDALPGVTLEETEDAIVVRGALLLLTRDMVSRAYFAGQPRDPGSVDMFMNHFALGGVGNRIASTPERVVFCDDGGERSMAFRMRADHQAEIAMLSEQLGISRNEFVLRAVDRYIADLRGAQALTMGGPARPTGEEE